MFKFSIPEECKDGALDLVMKAAKRTDVDISSIGPETSLVNLNIDPLEILKDAEDEFNIDLGPVSQTGLPRTVEDLQKILLKSFSLSESTANEATA